MDLLDNKKVGKRLEELRKAKLFPDSKGVDKPLSNNAFAVRAKIDSSQYSKIEKGELPITEKVLNKIINTYGFDKEYILFGTVIPNIEAIPKVEEEIQAEQMEEVVENIESENKDIASNSEMTGMFLILIEHLQKIGASLSSTKDIVQQNNSLIQTVLLRMAQEKEHSPQDAVKIFDGSLKVAEEFLKSNFERTEKGIYEPVSS